MFVFVQINDGIMQETRSSGNGEMVIQYFDLEEEQLVLNVTTV